MSNADLPSWHCSTASGRCVGSNDLEDMYSGLIRGEKAVNLSLHVQSFYAVGSFSHWCRILRYWAGQQECFGWLSNWSFGCLKDGQTKTFAQFCLNLPILRPLQFYRHVLANISPPWYECHTNLLVDTHQLRPQISWEPWSKRQNKNQRLYEQWIKISKINIRT